MQKKGIIYLPFHVCLKNICAMQLGKMRIVDKIRGLGPGWHRFMLLNKFLVLHMLKPLVRPRCSKPFIHIVSLLNQQISLFLHSMFPLLCTSWTAKANHICDLLCALCHRTNIYNTVHILLRSAPSYTVRAYCAAIPLLSGSVLLTELFFLSRTGKRKM